MIEPITLGAPRAESNLATRLALGFLTTLSILLAACGGSNSDSALSAEDSAQEAASERAQALAATPTTAPPAGATWTGCAAEGGVCTVPGSVTVRYGANGTYFYATVTGSVACSNAQWGDPSFGFVKACAYTSAAPTSTPTATTSSWVNCANEGGVCAVSGTRNVRYGANGSYFYKTVTGQISCGNGAWGDPLFGVAKSCAYESSSTTAAPTTAGSWVNCAAEGGMCSVSNTRNVRYGANGVYFYKAVTGQIACANAAWGGDPIVGVAKSCAYDSGTTTASPTPAPTPTLGTAALQWNAATDPRVVGYRVYWGSAPGNYQQARGSGLAAGAATSFTVRDLPSGRTYYFAVTAQDSSGVESAFSAEAAKTIP